MSCALISINYYQTHYQIKHFIIVRVAGHSLHECIDKVVVVDGMGQDGIAIVVMCRQEMEHWRRHNANVDACRVALDDAPIIVVSQSNFKLKKNKIFIN